MTGSFEHVMCLLQRSDEVGEVLCRAGGGAKRKTRTLPNPLRVEAG